MLSAPVDIVLIHVDPEEANLRQRIEISGDSAGAASPVEDILKIAQSPVQSLAKHQIQLFEIGKPFLPEQNGTLFR